jgi:hypothetical protein
MSKSKTKILSVGDVLRTNPCEGYWGCAVVLTVRDKTPEFAPMCHIGITTSVYTHEYCFEELNLLELEILRIERQIRVAPNKYKLLRKETCIGIYSRRITPPVVVIGSADPVSLFSSPLEFIAGDTTDGGWPFCGKIEQSLGNEAIHSWRAEHDRDAWLKEIAEAERSHEEMLVRLKKKGTQQNAPADR